MALWHSGMMGWGWMFFPFMIFWFLVGFFVFIFWIWMIIDCLTRKKFEDKLVWILVLLFLNVLGAILYFFLVKSKKNRRFE